jgi:hypothetical protein
MKRSLAILALGAVFLSTAAFAQSSIAALAERMSVSRQ